MVEALIAIALAMSAPPANHAPPGLAVVSYDQGPVVASTTALLQGGIRLWFRARGRNPLFVVSVVTCTTNGFPAKWQGRVRPGQVTPLRVPANWRYRGCEATVAASTPRRRSIVRIEILAGH